MYVHVCIFYLVWYLFCYYLYLYDCIHSIIILLYIHIIKHIRSFKTGFTSYCDFVKVISRNGTKIQLILRGVELLKTDTQQRKIFKFKFIDLVLFCLISISLLFSFETKFHYCHWSWPGTKWISPNNFTYKTSPLQR